MAGSQDPNHSLVSIQVVPMVGIMFLLLLFIMLGADMSQRVTEDSKLPNTQTVKEDPKKKGYEATAVNLVGERESWHAAIAGHHYPDWDSLERSLYELAHQPGEEEPGNAPGTYFSTRAIQLRTAPDCPYKHAQRLIQLLSKAGFYKIEVVASRPSAISPSRAGVSHGR